MPVPAPQSSVEIERKYEVPSSAALPAPETAGLHVSRESIDRLDAVYFDTADERLAAARVVLRRRTGGHDAGWHVKLPGAVGRRELRLPIGDDDVPDAFVRLLRPYTTGAQLTPLARLETTRRSVVLIDDDGSEAIELADDSVRATALRTGVVSSWREWEAETLPGAAADSLDRVHPLLLASGAVPARSASKLAQALGRDRLDPARTASDDGTVEAMLLRVLAPLIGSLHDAEVGLRLDIADDVEGRPAPAGEHVHEARKAVRRARSVVAAAAHLLPEPAAGLGDALRELGHVLGAARDAEVLARSAERVLDAAGDGYGADEARARLVDGWTAATVAPRAALLAHHDGGGHHRLLRRLEALRDALAGATGGADGRTALARVLDRERRRAGTALAGIRFDDEERVHDARKAVRRLRLVAEALHFLDPTTFGPGVARLARRGGDLQDVLGLHLDLVLLAGRVRSEAPSMQAAGAPSYHLGVVATRAEAEAAALLGAPFRRAARRFRAAI